MEEHYKNRRRCYFSKCYFIIIFFFDKINSVGDYMKNRIKLFLVFFLVLLTDQITKILVINNSSVIFNKEIIKDFFYLTFVKNYGGAWGIFEGNRVLLLICGLIGIVTIVHLIKKESLSNFGCIYYGLLLGGILGNIIDRVVYGYVIDFLNFYIFSYDFPVFNVADIGIVIGVFLLIIEMCRSEYNERSSRKRGC